MIKKILIVILSVTLLFFIFFLNYQKLDSLEDKISDLESRIDDLEYQLNQK